MCDIREFSLGIWITTLKYKQSSHTLIDAMKDTIEHALTCLSEYIIFRKNKKPQKRLTVS